MRTVSAIILIIAVSLSVEVLSISVPTGKETPITPAKPTPRPVYPVNKRAPAPVVEYTEESPEPAPLDPSYVPITYKYIQGLMRNPTTYFVPVVIRTHYGKNGQDYSVDNTRVAYKALAQNPAELYVPITIRNAYSAKNTEEQDQYVPYKASDNEIKKPQFGKYRTKPLYYLPKHDLSGKVPTKGGYPKKATAQASNKYYYYENQNQ